MTLDDLRAGKLHDAVVRKVDVTKKYLNCDQELNPRRN
jgi:hypothetical protein